MAKENQIKASKGIGIILTIAGIAGFFSGSSLIGFGINALHNSIHLVTGLLGIGAATKDKGKYAQVINKWLGIIYILIFLLGVIFPNFMLNLLNINMADNILHLILGGLLVYVGYKK